MGNSNSQHHNKSSASSTNNLQPSHRSVLHQPTPTYRIPTDVLQPAATQQSTFSQQQQQQQHRPPSNIVTGQLKLMLMPADHSCLFHSVSYLCDAQEVSHKAAKLQRMRCAKFAAQHPDVYNSGFLGTDESHYQHQIVNDAVWGGAVELDILSNIFQVEIFAFDLALPLLYTFGTGRGFTKRIFIVYSGEHYDAFVWLPKLHIKVGGKRKKVLSYFAVDDVGVLLQVKFLVERLSTFYQSQRGKAINERSRYELSEFSWRVAKRDKDALKIPPAKWRSSMEDWISLAAHQAYSARMIGQSPPPETRELSVATTVAHSDISLASDWRQIEPTRVGRAGDDDGSENNTPTLKPHTAVYSYAELC